MQYSRLCTADKIIVGYSGGLDSTVLLHQLTQCKNPEITSKLIAVHVNHGLSDSADDWQNHCITQCQKLKVPIKALSIKIKPEKGESLEAIARAARYQALASFMTANSFLVTAHHEDDQIETFLLQLFRGAGIKGLAAMPEIRPFTRGYLFRPLLSFTKKALEAYAIKHHLSWIEDDSNTDFRIRRNFIRHQILPELNKLWPNLNKPILRTIAHQQSANQLLDDLAKIDLKALKKQNTLSIDGLLSLSFQRRFNALRYWMQTNYETVPSQMLLQQIERSILKAREDSLPLINFQRLQIRRFRNNLYCLPTPKDFDTSQVITWHSPDKPLRIADLNITLDPAILADFEIHQKKVTVKFRQGGEKIYMPKRKKTLKLKNLMLELAIPPWERDRVPLIYVDDVLKIAVY